MHMRSELTLAPIWVVKDYSSQAILTPPLPHWVLATRMWLGLTLALQQSNRAILTPPLRRDVSNAHAIGADTLTLTIATRLSSRIGLQLHGLPSRMNRQAWQLSKMDLGSRWVPWLLKCRLQQTNSNISTKTNPCFIPRWLLNDHLCNTSSLRLGMSHAYINIARWENS